MIVDGQIDSNLIPNFCKIQTLVKSVHSLENKRFVFVVSYAFLADPKQIIAISIKKYFSVGVEANQSLAEEFVHFALHLSPKSALRESINLLSSAAPKNQTTLSSLWSPLFALPSYSPPRSIKSFAPRGHISQSHTQRIDSKVASRTFSRRPTKS